MGIRYSALNSRLLLPPICTPDDRVARRDRPDVEPADAVFAAEEDLLEDRERRACGRTAGCIRPRARKPNDVRCGLAACTRSPRPAACMNFVLPPRPGDVERQREAPAGRREDRVVDRVVDVARSDLADRPLAAFADQQRVGEQRIARQHARIA